MAISGLGKSPLSSQIIGGRYRVECCIASGVEASVVGAVDTATGKRVALKCWEGPTSEQEVAAVQCFVRSANVSGLFENPHVVEVFGTELGDTVSYSVSEWLEGSTLAREVERLGRLTIRDALRHLLPCVRAVTEAHAAGIVHGDIRPAHIFLCRAKRHLPERTRLFDFGRGMPGFSELRLPARGVVDELCRYTPPELLRGGMLDARSDIYAFGLMLYEITTGEHVFKADDLRDLLRAIDQGPQRAIDEVTQTLPRAFVEVLYRAMAPDPEQRYQELATFLDALTPFSRNQVVQTEVYAPPIDASKERAYPSRGPWVSASSSPDTKPKTPAARVTLSRIPPFRDVDDKIIIPRRKPLLQAAAVIAFFGISYLALDQGVKGTGHNSPAVSVTSNSPALDTAPRPLPIEPVNTFEPLPVPNVGDDPPREPDSVASVAAPSRRARRAERRRAARAAEASKRSADEAAHEPEPRRTVPTPVIDETIPAADSSDGQMELQ